MSPRSLTDEWQRTDPDLTIYLPAAFEGPDAANQHFNVVRSPAGSLLAFWTMATYENAPDQRVVFSRSTDDGRSWSAPIVLDGAGPGDPPGTGLASWEFPVVAPGMGVNGSDRVYCFYNKNVGINEKRELDDAVVTAVLRKLSKQRREGIAEFTKGGRADLAEKEKAELAILESYLPRDLDDAEIETEVRAAIAAAGATSKKDMGRVMKAAMERVQGRADGKRVQAAVQKLLP